MLPATKTKPTLPAKRALVLVLAAAALLRGAGGAAVASATREGDACAEQVVRDLRAGKLAEVAKLLQEPPSYSEEQAAQDREGSVAALRAVLETAGDIAEATPMAGRRRYYRVQLSGGTAEAWSTIGRPMVAEIVERDVRFARAGRGVLILKLARGSVRACGLASLDLGLDADQPEARDEMIGVYAAVLEAIGAGDDRLELRQRAESMLTTYDAGGTAPAATPLPGAAGTATGPSGGTAPGVR